MKKSKEKNVRDPRESTGTETVACYLSQTFEQRRMPPKLRDHIEQIARSGPPQLQR